jgi:hypothetical protein
MEWNQIFASESGTAPFLLSWLGSLDIDTSTLLPALLIIFVAGCFSVLNAHVGAVLTVIVAVILTWLGWISIPVGALVTSMFLAILMALIYAKRRVGSY